MPKKSSSGRYILSAGEIGAYTVCPEAWRLKNIAGTKPSIHENIKRGLELHAIWAEQHEEVIFLTWAVRAVVLLMLMCVTIYALS